MGDKHLAGQDFFFLLFNCSSVSSTVGVGSLAEFRGSPGIFLFGSLNFCRTWKPQTENKLQSP